jgi:acetylornithine deacetylase
MAAMLAAVERVSRTPIQQQPSIVVACTVNEENGFDGVRHLCTLWQTGRSRILPRRPDWAVVAEPTELDVVVAHKGTVRWRLHTLGRAAHSSNPSAGENAIYRLAPVLTALEQYAATELPSVRNELLTGPSLSVGTVHGGVSVNTVPDRCTIEIDRRLLPHESAATALEHVKQFLESHVGHDRMEHEAPFLTSPGLAAGPNRKVAETLAAIAQQHGAPGRCLGVSFGTDAGVLAQAGVPTVVFGPGSITQAHTRDEWIAVDSLHLAVAILADFCVQCPGDQSN